LREQADRLLPALHEPDGDVDAYEGDDDAGDDDVALYDDDHDEVAEPDDDEGELEAADADEEAADADQGELMDGLTQSDAAIQNSKRLVSMPSRAAR